MVHSRYLLFVFGTILQHAYVVESRRSVCNRPYSRISHPCDVPQGETLGCDGSGLTPVCNPGQKAEDIQLGEDSDVHSCTCYVTV